MATTQTATLYNNAIPGIAAASLQCIATMVTDAAGGTQRNSVSLQYKAVVGGVDLELSREDFLAIRAMKAMP